MIRIMMMVCVVAIAWGVVWAAPSARLEALAGDGLLIEDAGADHQWPASLVGHGEMTSLRYSDRDIYQGTDRIGVDIRRRIGGPLIGRLWLDAGDVPDQDIPTITVQAAASLGAWDVGLVVARSGEVLRDDPPVYRDGVGLGLRWSPDAATVVEAGGQIGRAAFSGWTEGDDGSSAFRCRFYREIIPTVVLAAAWEAGEEHLKSNSGAKYMLGGHWDDQSLGLLVWPDPDVQLLLAATRYELVRDEELEPGEDFLWLQDWREAGIRIAAEARISAWATVRMGFHAVREESRLGGDGYLWTDVRHVRLGGGATIHAGGYDLTVAAGRDRRLIMPATPLWKEHIVTTSVELQRQF